LVIIRKIDRHSLKEIRLPLLAPYFGKEGDDLLNAMPELKTHLKARYPEVAKVSLVYRNPRPDAMSFLLKHGF
jgi:hypothetical protein